jgi:hypothetical protein
MDHMKTAHPRRSALICSRCLYTASSLASLKLHLITRHSRTYVMAKCVFCSTFFAERDQLKVHLSRAHAPYPDTACSICGGHFESRHHVAAHMQQAHAHRKGNSLDQQVVDELGMPMCKFCDASFVQISHLAQHLSLGHCSEVLPCWLCDKRFPSEIHLRDHLSRKHVAKPSKPKRQPSTEDCGSNPCSEAAASIESIRGEDRIMTGQEVIRPCEFCPSVSEVGDPQSVCIHVGGYVCLEPGCGTISANKTRLFQHMYSEHPGAAPILDLNAHWRTEFPCPLCGAVIVGRIMFKNHLGLHNAGLVSRQKVAVRRNPSPTPITAALAEEFFPALPSQMIADESIRHKSFHMDNTELSVAAQRETLVRVVELSSGYPCSTCGRRLAHFQQLISHVVTEHPGVSPLTCPLCRSPEAQTAADLKWHILRMHFIYCPFARCLFCVQLFSSKVK